MASKSKTGKKAATQMNVPASRDNRRSARFRDQKAKREENLKKYGGTSERDSPIKQDHENRTSISGDRAQCLYGVLVAFSHQLFGFDPQNLSEEDRETLAFKVLSDTHTKELLELNDVHLVEARMVEIMKLSNHVVDLKDAAVLDYYVAAFWWGKEQNYSNEQASAFFTVIHTLLENVKERQMTVSDNLKEYKKMLAGIGQEATELYGGLDCFDINQAKAITDYLHISLFQHYRLYEFIFSHTQAEEIIGTDLEVEVAPAAGLPWPPPLEEGLAGTLHQEFIATPPATPEPQAGEGDGEHGEEGVAGADGVDGASSGMSGDVTEHEAEILAQLTPEEVKAIMQSVFDEMLSGVQMEVAQTLRDKENAFIQRINKIHKVADK